MVQKVQKSKCGTPYECCRILGRDRTSEFIGRIRSFCKLAVPIEVIFDHFVFGNQNFFIEPDKFSQISLKNITKGLHNHIGKKYSGIRPHISVARGLEADQMNIAKEIFKDTSVHFKFLFDELHLRKFNIHRMQYSDIVETFKFTGEPQPDLFS